MSSYLITPDRIMSAYSSLHIHVHTSPSTGPFAAPQIFGDVYSELNCSGWVNAVAWSPSGGCLAFAGHDSSVTLAAFLPEGPVTCVIKFKQLPLMQLAFVSEYALVGAGHDFNPLLFTQADGMCVCVYVCVCVCVCVCVFVCVCVCVSE
jgi:actin related protein 2/3 complex subunit 1A/1B